MLHNRSKGLISARASEKSHKKVTFHLFAQKSPDSVNGFLPNLEEMLMDIIKCDEIL